MKISIFNSSLGGWTVIADGRIADGLTMDEVLGQIATLLIVGRTQFRSHSIGEPDKPWAAPRALIEEKARG